MVAVLATILVPVTVLIGYQVVTDPSPYRQALDELKFPDAWTVPHADVEQRAILLTGTHVTRFFLADADPAETVAVVERIVIAAGYTVDRARGGCLRNPSDGPIESCTVAAIRNKLHLWIVMFARSEPVSYSFQGGDPAAGAPNLSVIRVAAGAYY